MQEESPMRKHKSTSILSTAILAAAIVASTFVVVPAFAFHYSGVK